MNIKNSTLLISLTMSVMVFSGVTIQVNAQKGQTDSNVEFLAIQHAGSGSINEINVTAYSLELNNVSDKTILFSDRPDRIVKPISTDNFVGNWSTGEDSFQADPPNAVLIVDGSEEQESTIELFNPIYNHDEKKLIYVITPDNATSIELPDDFGESTLVIDRLKHPTQY